MAYGLIKDTTLTAIADGLRELGIVPKLRDGVVDCDHYWSSNCTSETDPTPLGVRSSEEIVVSAIPGAHSVEFVFTVKATGTILDSSIGDLSIYKYGSTIKPYSTKIYRDTDSTFSVKIDPYYGGGPFTVKLAMPYSSNNNNCFGVVFDVYGIDADGNYIKIVKPDIEFNNITPVEMVEAIDNFDIASFFPDTAFTLTGKCRYRFANSNWDWFINLFKDKITTVGITELANMFSGSMIAELPFDINITNAGACAYAFQNAQGLTKCPKVRGTFQLSSPISVDLSNIIEGCFRLRDVNDLFTHEMLDYYSTYKVTSAYSCPKVPIFQSCYSLRTIPDWWYKFRLNEESTAFPAGSSGYSIYYSTFYNAKALDEITNVPVWRCQGAATSNVFNYFVYTTSRLKRLTFETDNGQPIETKWKSQTIDCSVNVGYLNSKYDITYYNSGITDASYVSDDATYQALKDSPDWYTDMLDYSRYNHDSAVETINSLPDTSAYLATAGGTNTIKFKGASGAKTDGGAINTLTAEEIAVAAAKGWTVSLV